MVEPIRITAGQSHFHDKAEQFGQMTYRDLVGLANSPRNLTQYPYETKEHKRIVKAKLWWLIPSNCPSKTKAEMMEHGEYSLLVSDLDKGNRTPSDISTILEATGIESYTIYDTASSVQGDRRLRVVIPLTETVCAKAWLDLQIALTTVLGDADDCTTRAQQISYLPTLTAANKDCYESLVSNGPSLNPFASRFADIAQGVAKELALEEANKKTAKSKPTVITKPMVSADGLLNPLVVFNQSKDWVSLLEECGFKRQGKRWLPPCSSSGVAGAVISYVKNPQGAYISPHNSDPLNYKDWMPSDKLDVWIVHKLGLDHRDRISTAIALREFSDTHIVEGGVTLAKYNQIKHAQNIDEMIDLLVDIKLPEEFA